MYEIESWAHVPMRQLEHVDEMFKMQLRASGEQEIKQAKMLGWDGGQCCLLLLGE